MIGKTDTAATTLMSAAEILDRVLPRADTAAELTRHGLPTTVRQLANAACAGTGPTYSRAGRMTMYRYGDALEWRTLQEPPDRTEWVTRPELAALLSQHGYRYSALSLQSSVSMREGPPHRVYGGKAFYHVQTALGWAAGRYARIGKVPSGTDKKISPRT